jgi:hypothetical protein
MEKLIVKENISNGVILTNFTRKKVGDSIKTICLIKEKQKSFIIG